eukprot:TRINITY_DN63444_c0_g1_i1.p1 TRINITY_DN63444_c0_g1~~TRINITY_DN63444_c0_g1_i1.p1  ORF type:complete len:263 (+),score=30.26 TRINITY_DN63444_c0_g1_i1:95-883(+)
MGNHWSHCLALFSQLFIAIHGHVTGDLFNVERLEPRPGPLPLGARVNETVLPFIVQDAFDGEVPYDKLSAMHARKIHMILIHAESAAAVLHLHPQPAPYFQPAAMAGFLPEGLPYSGLYYISWTFRVPPNVELWAQALIKVPYFCVGENTLSKRLHACGVSWTPAKSLTRSRSCSPLGVPRDQRYERLLSPRDVQGILLKLSPASHHALEQCFELQRYGGYTTSILIPHGRGKGPPAPRQAELPVLTAAEDIGVGGRNSFRT